MKVVRTVGEMKVERAEDTGLVPTMGALHAGHVSLLEAARRENGHVVMSLFVNEAQFSSADDFARYPRDEQRDLELAERVGVDVVFAPAADELYPPGFRTWVEPDEHGLEADHRPGHFRAVATVCVKLFNIVRPRRAYFGQKDAQQVDVVRRMIRDLNLDVELRVLPTVRDVPSRQRRRSRRREIARLGHLPQLPGIEVLAKIISTVLSRRSGLPIR